MTYIIKRYEDLPVVFFAMEKDYRMRVHANEAMSKLFEILHASNQPLFLIMDLRDLTLSVSDLISGTNHTAQDLNLFDNPKIIDTIVITKNRMLKYAAKGINSPVFGNVKIHVTKNIDEALNIVRRRV